MNTTIPAANDLDFRNYKLLIVDDNPTNLKVLFDYFEQYGFELLIARDSETAIQRASYAQPDLILLDVVMPGTDGFQTCLHLKAHDDTKDIPVIFMTALSSPDNKVKGFEVGGIDYVTKPLQYDEVLARVTTHLRICELQHRLEAQNAMLTEKNQQLQEEIAQRKRIAKRLKHVNQQLQEANASKDTLFSIIAHDLRAPFSALLGLSETIINYIDDYTKEEIRDNMLSIRASSEAVYGLLENLLAWSRLQRGLLVCHPDVFALAELTEDTLSLFQTRAAQKHLSLANRVPKQTLVYADKSMIGTVLRNLLSNALKFTSPGDQIVVSSSQTDAQVNVAITDTGLGIDPRVLPTLFRRDTYYTQVGTDGEQGTGLGLRLCKDLVEKNHGAIWAESVVGQGTTFMFSLPSPAAANHEDTDKQ